MQYTITLTGEEQALMDFLIERQGDTLLGDARKRFAKENSLSASEIDEMLALFGRFGLLGVDYGGDEYDNPVYRMRREQEPEDTHAP
jgi:hypothetical protein